VNRQFNSQFHATKKIAEILHRRSSQYCKNVEDVDDVRSLPKSIREAVVQVLADELCENGLAADSEPTQYGLVVEALIDACGLTEI